MREPKSCILSRLDKHELSSTVALWAACLALVALPAYFLWDWPMFDASILQDQNATRCGDGQVQGREQCDDGNALIMDGCTGCMIEAGFACTGAPSRCTQGGSELPFVGCGNGMPDAGEQCDDQNAVTGDGCSSYCFIETGFACEGVPSVCAPSSSSASSESSVSSDISSIASSPLSESSASSASSVSLDSSASSVSLLPASSTAPASSASAPAQRINARAARTLYASSESALPAPPPAPAGIKPSCGDERILGAETCDDGNATGGDGCSAACATETGYRCDGTPSRCVIACGDGVVMAGETCDDGGNNPGDGCSAGCRIEARWRCDGAPSACTQVTYCGDGITEGAETCDDGNDIAGDGCSPSCTAEQPVTE